MVKIYQIGVLPAFMNGIYEGDIPFKKIEKLGDLGLGTVNGLKGELVVLDGDYYQMDESGRASKVNPLDATPFTIVTKLTLFKTVSLEHINNLDEVSKCIEKVMDTPNVFYMFRIDGVFSDVHLRSEHCEMMTHQPLYELLPSIQKKFTLEKSEGTIVGTFCPAYSAGFTIQNFHYHYINRDRTFGGHVFDVKIEHAILKLQKSHEFDLQVFQTPDFYQCSLDVDMQAALKKVEND